jgi:hypothetical protein
MKRLIVALMVGGALFAVVAFAAASMTLNAGSLSQGQASVTDCAGGQTVNLDWYTGGSNPVVVTSVDVDAPAGCYNATATVEIFDNAAGFQGAASCIADGNGDCNANLPDTDIALVDWARVTLAGP